MTHQSLDLDTLGRRLRTVDKMVVQLLAARHRLSLEVGASKIEANGQIFRPGIEEARITDACNYGELFGLNRNYVASVMYSMIRESCMDQIIQRESKDTGRQHALSYEERKANLLALTKVVAGTYDAEYASHSTAVYLKFEDAVLEDHIHEMPREDRGRFLDLGCGTGNIALRAAPLFKSVTGYDLSPHMLAVARKKAEERKLSGETLVFEETDLEDGVPEPDATASFVAMSLGTASDLRNIKKVISETLRVLKDGGRFMFSFYNTDALLYQWSFLPWQIGLTARINHDFHCLDVEAKGKIYEVYARPYTVAEVKQMFSGIGHLAVRTYPTLSAVLPSEAFAGENIAHIDETVGALDKQLQFGNHGAYIIVTGVK